MLKRRTLLQATAASTLSTIGLPSSHALAQTKSNTLRFVPQANLSVLDPIFTTAAVTITHGYCVFDTLYGVDSKLTAHPQMAESASVSNDERIWTIRLRDGLRFHDGEPVRAQDCAASLLRWSKKDTFGLTLGAAVDAFEAADDRTIRIRLKRPFPRLLDAIGKPHSSPAFMMPERLARTDPNTPITEMIGSGPFRFKQDEYVSGAKVVYERNADYRPRTERAEWTSGGKQVHLDRLEWIIIPDASTTAAALQRGEIDWWEQPINDLIPLLQKTPQIKLQVQDPYGFMAVARFNSTQPPFDNVKLREIVLSAVKQSDYMQAIMGTDESSWRTCTSSFPVGFPGVNAAFGTTRVGSQPDHAAARAAVKAAGYKGEKVVIINPTDQPLIGPTGEITADLLKSIGFDVDLQDMDWGSVMSKRLSHEPPGHGGWNIYHTNWPSVSIANPALNTTIRGDGAWAGWFVDAEMERLVGEWVSSADPTAQQTLFNTIQNRALDQVPSLPLGMYFIRGAFRDSLADVSQGPACYFWGVRRV